MSEGTQDVHGLAKQIEHCKSHLTPISTLIEGLVLVPESLPCSKQTG
jgi:hypothetical protein